MTESHFLRVVTVATLGVIVALSPCEARAEAPIGHLTEWPAVKSRPVDCGYQMRIAVTIPSEEPATLPQATVTQRLWYRNTTGEPMRALYMVGPSPKTIAEKDGSALTVSKANEQGVWEVQLDRPLASGARIDLSMQFDVAFRVPEYNFQEYRELAGAWHPKVVDMEASGPFEGPNGAIASYDATVVFPSGWNCVTSGLKREERSSDNSKIVEFVVDHVADFAVVLTKELESIKREAAGVSIEVLHRPERKEQAGRMADMATDVVEFYKEQFGFYPHPYLCIVMLGQGFGGGPVGGGIVRVNDSIDRDVVQTAWGVAHEIGHEYWGFECVVDSDHLTKWFGLGMGLYSDRLYCRKRALDAPQHRAYVNDYRKAVRLGLESILIPDPPRPVDRRIAHAKGFVVVDLLHYLLGERRFNDAVADFLTTYRYRRVRQDDIQSVLQKHAPEDLSDFFHDSLRTDKAFDCGIKKVSSRKVSGKFLIDVELESIGGLALPVPVEVRLVDGRRLRRRSTLASMRASLHTDRDWYSAIIDPDLSLPETDRANNVAWNPDAPPVFEISEVDLSDMAWGQNVLKIKVKNNSDVEEKIRVWIGGQYESGGGFGMGMDPISIAPGEERWIKHPYYVAPRPGKLTGRIEFVMPHGSARPQDQEPFLVKKYSVTFDTPNPRCNELTPLTPHIQDFPELFGKYRDGTRIPAFVYLETQHFVFYCYPGTPAHADMPKIKADREKAFSEIGELLGVQLEEKVSCFFYPDAADKYVCTLHRGDGLAFDNTTAEIYNEKTKLDPYHELTHIVARQIGNPPALFREGLATYMSERLGAPPLKNLGGGEASLYERARELKGKGDWIPPEELLAYTEIGSEKSRPPVSYAEAGAFVKFLVDAYGREKFLEAYKSLRNSNDKAVHHQNKEKLERIYGKSLQALSQEWHAAMAPSHPSENQTADAALAEEERHQRAATEIGKLGGVVAVKTSERGEEYTEVTLLGPGHSREWKGGTQAFKHLSRLTNVRSLRIQDVEEFSDEHMVHVKGLRTLRSLMLVRTGVADEGLVYLKNLTNLEFLGLMSDRFTDGALKHIKGLKGLKSLRLDDAEITDKGVKKLKESGLLAPLEFLVLSNTRITDAGLAHLTGMINLKWLYIRDTAVADAGLAHLKGLPKLEMLILNNTGVTDAGIVHLKGLTNLSSLYLRDTEVTDAGLEALTGLANLSYLHLSGPQVTDPGLAHLGKLAKLEELGLDGCGISDAGLEHLKGLKRLKTVYLNRTEITKEGYEKIKGALPNCEIYWEPVRPGDLLRVGDWAPELSIDRLLQAPNGAVASWESLKGKVVVLEFWATSCGPCISAIPHMNDIAEGVKDKPVQFICVTREEQSVVERFLQEHPIKGWVGLDPDRSVAASYGVRAIPRTVVVDKSGMIRAITRPTSLARRTLDRLLADQN